MPPMLDCKTFKSSDCQKKKKKKRVGIVLFCFEYLVPSTMLNTFSLNGNFCPSRSYKKEELKILTKTIYYQSYKEKDRVYISKEF